MTKLKVTGVESHETGSRFTSLYFFGLILSGISIRIIGNVYLGEIILAILTFDRVLSSRKYPMPKMWRFFMFSGVIWIFANLIGSIHADKSLTVILISIFTPILTICCLSTCVFFMSKSENLLFRSVLFFSIGRLIGLLLDPLPYTSSSPWKFGYGDSVILLFISCSYFLRFVKIQWMGQMALGVISLLNQARTLAFIVFISSLALVPFQKPNKGRLFFLIMGLFVPILYWIYISLGLSGNLGLYEVKRATLLTSTDFGPIAARKEFIFSARAFFESPFLGYGFNPKVDPQIILSGYQFWAEQGYPISNFDPSVLPVHSFLWGALVQGGIFAGLFWIICLVIAIEKVVKIMEYNRRIRVLILYSAMAMIFNIVFSPYGAYERLYVAILMGTLIAIKLNTSNRESYGI